MARHWGIAVLSLLGLLVLPTAVTAQAPTILYVNGTDPTCGGDSPCFTTIQTAINAAGPGNPIHNQTGTHTEKLTITDKNNFSCPTESNRMLLETHPAAPPGSVVLT